MGGDKGHGQIAAGQAHTVFGGTPALGEKLCLPRKLEARGVHQGFVDGTGYNGVKPSFEGTGRGGLQCGQSGVRSLGSRLPWARRSIIAQDLEVGQGIELRGAKGESHHFRTYPCRISHGHRDAWFGLSRRIHDAVRRRRSGAVPRCGIPIERNLPRPIEGFLATLRHA